MAGEEKQRSSHSRKGKSHEKTRMSLGKDYRDFQRYFTTLNIKMLLHLKAHISPKYI